MAIRLKLYREWRVLQDEHPPTLKIAVINGPFGQQLCIERIAGGLVVINPTEARKLAKALSEAADYLEVT